MANLRWEMHLALAERQVAAARLGVERQRLTIADLERDGLPTAVALRLLDTYEELVDLHMQFRDRLRQELALPPAAPEIRPVASL